LLRVAQRKGAKLVAAVAAAGLVLTPAFATAIAAKKRAPAVTLSFDPVSSFTPANADPKLAAALSGKALALTDFKFTPAAAKNRPSQVRVAIRARTLAPTQLASAPGSVLNELTPTGYNLGERLPSSPGEQEVNGYREIDWEALIPPAWDPKRALAGLDLSKLNDNDPGANEALARLRSSWAAAPLAESMNNARIRIAGFVVPLEYVGDKVTEFLLVPYFGACIHLPPPPPNQVIHVFAKQPITRKQASRPVWTSGVLETSRTDTEFGPAGYQLKAEEISAYRGR